MISNYQHALDLANHIAEVDETPRELAKQLHQYGLLMPDLPEPEDPGIFVPGGKGWLPCGPVGPSVWTAPNSLIMVQRVEPGDFTPAQARELALALLAAANHAEAQAREMTNG